MRKIAAFVAAISLLGVAIVFGAGNGVCMHISVPLSIVHTLRELRECTILLAIVIVILFVEMWCEYIRACTAHTFIVLSLVHVRPFSLSVSLSFHSVCSVSAYSQRLGIGIGVCDLSRERARKHTYWLHAYFVLLELTNSRPVDIQQWQRAHTNTICLVLISGADLNLFWISFALRNFWKQYEIYTKQSHTAHSRLCRSSEFEFWRCV